jgi:hypothetical protein
MKYETEKYLNFYKKNEQNLKIYSLLANDKSSFALTRILSPGVTCNVDRIAIYHQISETSDVAVSQGCRPNGRRHSDNLVGGSESTDVERSLQVKLVRFT